MTTVLHSHQQCVRVVICPYPHQHVLSVFMILIIQVVGNGVVLICISLMINDIENLFLCLLAICISSLKKRLFRYFSCFLNGIICLFTIKLQDFFIYSRCKLFVVLNRWFEKNFPQLVAYLSIPFLVFFLSKIFKLWWWRPSYTYSYPRYYALVEHCGMQIPARYCRRLMRLSA